MNGSLQTELENFSRYFSRTLPVSEQRTRAERQRMHCEDKNQNEVSCWSNINSAWSQVQYTKWARQEKRSATTEMKCYWGWAGDTRIVIIGNRCHVAKITALRLVFGKRAGRRLKTTIAEQWLHQEKICLLPSFRELHAQLPLSTRSLKEKCELCGDWKIVLGISTIHAAPCPCLEGGGSPQCLHTWHHPASQLMGGAMRSLLEIIRVLFRSKFHTVKFPVWNHAH